MDNKNKERLELIEKLFTWKAPLELKDGEDAVVNTVYQKLIGDSDLNKARVTSLRYSRELRGKLKDPTSDEYFAYVDILNDYNKEEIITLILFDELIDMRTEAEKDFYFPEPETPGEDATTEDEEEYQRLQDTYEDRRIKALDDRVKEILEARKNNLDSETEDYLKERAINSRVDSICENELRSRFLNMCTYLGTFLDSEYKYRLFKDFDEFLNSPEALKSQLVSGYNRLEVSSINLKGFQKIHTSDP